MTVDVLLIVPPLVNYDKKRSPRTLINTSFYPPLGVAYLAAFLQFHKINVEIIDMDAEKFGVSEITNIIRHFKPRIIGLSIPAEMLCAISLHIIQKIEECSQAPLIIGGVFPSFNPEYFLKKSNVNFIVRGEGEKTLLELARYILLKEGNLDEINGISYNKEGIIIHNSERDLIQNLDDIPFPAWEKLSVNKYFFSFSYRNPSFAITASRGCPYRCIFCSSSVFKYHRLRSPENVVDEIEALIKNYSIKDISFMDPTINVNPKWLISMCKEIIRRKIKIKWRCLARVDKVEEKMIAYMKAAGCYNIVFGIESSKDKFINFLKKDFTITQVESAIKLVKKYKIEILTSFMYGIPGQSKIDLEHNISFIKKIIPDYLNILILNPSSGTELHHIAKKKKWLINEDFATYEEPEKIAVTKQIWKLPNLSEELINYYIKKTYIVYFLKLETLKLYFERYLKTPSRFFNAIKNLVHRLI
jgi:radical SAM superfamily enzyme YgiQ (UPF0313 family)